jgi:glycosyltransferase involved in cell wall biosynthesis
VRVGVVIRTLDERELIGRCLEVLHGQQGEFDLEVVVVDSGSTDGTLELARAGGARIVELPPGEFDYSRSLNLGIEEAQGDVVVSLSAHAIPVDDRWLARMTAPFDDARVAGVACRQIPWPDAPWQEVHRLGHQFPHDGNVASSADDPAVVFSNAASAIRRDAWREHPFTLPAAEDLEWARRVLAHGHLIVYEAETSVYHSHVEGPRAQALRMIDINRVLDADAAGRSRLRTLREAAGIFVRDMRKILALDETPARKARYAGELFQMVCWYAADFSRSGTTAERRRDESPAPDARRST